MEKTKIVSPLPELFIESPHRNLHPYKKSGDPVEVGDVIGLIEVMKNFHEVKAEQAGENIVFRAEDSAPIEPGEIIAELEG